MTRSLEPHGRVPAKLGRLSIAKYYGVYQVAAYCYDFGDRLVVVCSFYVAAISGAISGAFASRGFFLGLVRLCPKQLL